MNYEEIVQFLNEIPKTEFFNNPEMVKQFLVKYDEFAVNQTLDKRLQEEHINILHKDLESIRVKGKSKEPFKHFVRNSGKFVIIYLTQ